MKKILALLLCVSIASGAYTQCSSVGVQISSSDTFYVQLYHAAFFNIASGFDNVVEWTVTTFEGETIHKDMTSGDWEEQSFSLFDHMVPLADSMKATIVITNETTGITCTVSDTLFWEETEVLPGFIFGNWAVLSNNVGVEEVISSSTDIFVGTNGIELYPVPAIDQIQLKSDVNIHSFVIFDAHGQTMQRYSEVELPVRVNVSSFAPGTYFIQFMDQDLREVGVKRFIKQ